MAEITLQGIGPNAPPGIYGVINFGAGSGSLGNTVYSILLMGDMTSAGTATSGTVYGSNTQVTCQTSADAQVLFGANSPLANMFTDVINVNPALQVFCQPTTASGVAASTTFTVTTSSPQTTGVVRLILCTTIVDTVFGTTDTATTIASNIVGMVNGNTTLPFVATNVAGVVTLTASTAGARGNWLRVSAQVISGSGVKVNGTTFTGRSFLTGGSGSNQTSYNTNIANLVAAGLRYYTIVSEAGADSVDGYNTGNTGNLIIEDLQSNLIDLLAEPQFGIRQRLICGSVDTLGNTVATTTGVNDPRVEVINLTNSDLPPSRLAARWAAAKVTFEVPFLQASGVNFCNFGSTNLTQNYWNVPAPLDGSSPSATNVQTAVVSGVTIVKAISGGGTKVVKSCTTHFWTGNSSQFDPRIVDAGKVTVSDYFLDDVESALTATFNNGELVGPDPESGPIPPNTVTPSIVRGVVRSVINQYSGSGLIDGNATTDGLLVQLSTVAVGRIEIQVPLFTADPLETFVIQVNQVS